MPSRAAVHLRRSGCIVWKMKIDTKDIPGLRDLALDTSEDLRFSSSLPSEDLITLAWGNPDFAQFVEEKELGKSLVANAALANRYSQGIAGLRLGVPSNVQAEFKQAVWKWGPEAWRSYGEGLATSAMDIGLAGMGALPVIGWAAEIAVSVVKLIIERSKAKKTPPANIRYSKEADEAKASEALRLLNAGKVERIFSPPGDSVTAWEVKDATPGYTVKWVGEPGGLGVLPGAAMVAGSLFSEKRWNPENFMACNKSRRVCYTYKRENANSKVRQSVRWEWDSTFRDTVMAVGDTLPSLRRVGAAVWSMLSSTESANAFELDTRGLFEKWEAWGTGVSEISARRIDERKEILSIDEYVGLRALNFSSRLDFYGYESTKPIHWEGQRRLAEVRELQAQLLDTLVVAYCLESQPAFGDWELRTKLQARRVQLLTHPARWRVDSRDIVDPEYRKAMDESKSGGPPLAAVMPADGGEFDGKPKRISPLAEAGTGPGASGGAAIMLLAAAGAAAFTARLR